MFNVIISEDAYLKLKKEGFVFEYAEMRITIRGKYYEALVEFIWDEDKHLIIVLTKDKVYYAEKITIGGQKYPIVFITDKKGIGRSIKLEL